MFVSPIVSSVHFIDLLVLKTAYTLTLDQIESRVKAASYDMFKIRQVLIQGGHNPNLKIEYYEDAFRMISRKIPICWCSWIVYV